MSAWQPGEAEHTPCRAVPLKSRIQSGMVGARHGMCESNMVALYNSNGKDIF